jgi:hypothetical protein
MVKIVPLFRGRHIMSVIFSSIERKRLHYPSGRKRDGTGEILASAGSPRTYGPAFDWELWGVVRTE